MLLFAVSMILSSIGTCQLSSSISGFNGARLKFVVFNNPPYSTLIFRPDGNYTFSGTGPLWQVWMAQKLNFTIEYMMLNQSTIDRNGGSDFEYALQLVVNKEVDAYVNGLVATPERKRKVDLTYFIWTEPYSMVVPRPEEYSRIFAFVYPYQSTVWLLIFVTLITVLLLMSWLSRIYLSITNNDAPDPPLTRYRKTVTYYVNYYMMHILSVITNQGGYFVVARFTSFRILVGVWLLIATVLVNVYSSTVIAYLTVPRTKPSIKTFEDLAASPDVSILLRAETLIAQHILTAKTGALKTIGDQARRYPDRLWTDQEKINSRLATGRHAYPWVQSFCQFYVVNRFKRDGTCRFRISDPLPFQPAFFSLALQKNSKLTPAFNKALMVLWESGLFPYWVRNVIPQAPECFAKTKPRTISTHKVPIQLADLAGVFFVYGIGLGLATLAILIEKIVSFWGRRMKSTGKC